MTTVDLVSGEVSGAALWASRRTVVSVTGDGAGFTVVGRDLSGALLFSLPVTYALKSRTVSVDGTTDTPVAFTTSLLSLVDLDENRAVIALRTFGSLTYRDGTETSGTYDGLLIGAWLLTPTGVASGNYQVFDGDTDHGVSTMAGVNTDCQLFVIDDVNTVRYLGGYTDAVDDVAANDVVVSVSTGAVVGVSAPTIDYGGVWPTLRGPSAAAVGFDNYGGRCYYTRDMTGPETALVVASPGGERTAINFDNSNVLGVASVVRLSSWQVAVMYDPTGGGDYILGLVDLLKKTVTSMRFWPGRTGTFQFMLPRYPFGDYNGKLVVVRGGYSTDGLDDIAGNPPGWDTFGSSFGKPYFVATINPAVLDRPSMPWTYLNANQTGGGFG